MKPPSAFALRPMGPGEGDRLLRIGELATRRLVATGHHPDAPPPHPSDYARFLVAHDVIVAERTADEALLGYAAGLDLGSLYWLAELAVDPAHLRRGIGRALLRATCEHASARFHRAVGLTTYRDVEFNARFYRECGFLTVSRQDHDATLEDRFLAELPAGVSPDARTVMVRWLR